MFGIKLFAHDIEVKNADGVTIYYVWKNNNTELAVSFKGNFYDSYSDEYEGSVTIPDSVEYNGRAYNVTSINNNAFYYCSNLTNVTIPNSVTSIGYSAFEGCTGLTSITIPNSVTSIDNRAFIGCSGLTSITIPSSVTSMGNYAFAKCSELTSVTLHCKEIGSWFSDLTKIKEVVMGDEVEKIGDYAFFGCLGLTSIIIPSSLTSIGAGAFEYSSSLGAISKLPNIKDVKVHVCDYAAFCNNVCVRAISQITDSYVQLIDDNNSELKEFIIPEGVNNVGNYVFYACSGLTSITIPNSVTSIGKGAFSNCNNLKSITIPNSVTTIGEYNQEIKGETNVEIISVIA